MTIWDPIFIQGTAGVPSYTAKEARFGWRAEDWDEGVKNRLAFKVTQRGAGTNMSVDVAAGDAIVQGDDQTDQGRYAVRNDATVNLTGFVAPGSNSRYDLVVVRVNDLDAGGGASNNVTIERVTGTAAGSPVIPAIPNTALVLAIIGPITPATTAITNAMIHDVHTGTGPSGVAGVRLLAGRRTYPGDIDHTFAHAAPSGWALCYGQAISRSTYPALFEELGTEHGVGDGSTTFNLPDCRGRAFVGADNMGGSDAGVLTSSNTLGTKMGSETVTLTSNEMPTHNHADVVHSHTIDPPNTVVTHNDANQMITYVGIGTIGLKQVTDAAIQANVGPNAYDTWEVDIAPFASANNAAANTGSAGSGAAHGNMQPSITGNTLIRLT